ncbi:RidA family protein [Iningainema tapete]|uniref:RidA family protein n=1 Tax=Iningainema tapete BLCC-T55 TaxID=2748662 RepID=A0A8J7C659_9CYAN|nr:RidA family protein [Iningainema tapete]MBD2773909.1 RidA family protein [Iningainema tapete BLCC-T55]
MNPNREVVEVEKTDFFMPYAPLIRVKHTGDLLFISGATALPLYHEHPHEHDKLNPPDDVREQTRLVMENLKKCLQASGATFADVVRTDVFVTNMEDQNAIGEVMEKYFLGNYPASTLVEVKRLVDRRLKLEVSAIAVTSDSQSSR